MDEVRIGEVRSKASASSSAAILDGYDARARGVRQALTIASGSRTQRVGRSARQGVGGSSTVVPYDRGMSLLVQCEFRVKRPGDEPELVRLARALASAVTDEPGTLRYQWFVAPRPGHYSILEEYVDADAAEAHNQHVNALLVEFFGVAELVSISFYGELNKYLRDWISGREGVAVHVPLR